MSANQARDIFIELVARVPAEQWDGRLAEMAGDDRDLCDKVAGLLAAHRRADSFLEQPAAPLGGAADADTATDSPDGPSTDPGREDHSGVELAGRYKLLEQIGEGGMGTVWMAQQTDPVRRLVAVKLIKAGMDSKQVLARFDAERQVLALMDHPNIAKVHDAGTTDAGRPFFVMELVKGIPITKYCDAHKLTPRQRLELFVPVCQAVQHAHQKGIIHRDLKPSNVLVAMYDDRPAPKVIDFGVAKATGQQLTEQTLHTGFGAVVGTLEYMSPEQATFNQLDVDTRSDVYSLGVLLYELLAGSPPFTRKELEQAELLEMLRLIREQEPSTPSTKLSSSDALPKLSANRGTEPKRLTRMVRGELDWIVMKALEKDRSRRYETANGFAQDVQRYLADEPVLACPPSAGYRLRKLIRRNKGLVLAASVVFLALLGGIISTTLGLFESRRQARLALAAQQKEKERAEAEVRQRRRARKVVDDMYNQVAEKWLAEQPRMEKVQRQFLEKALGYYEEFALADSSDPLEQVEAGYAYYRVGEIRSKLGDQVESEKAYSRAALVFEALAAAHGTTALYRHALQRTHNRLGGVWYTRDQLQDAETAYRRGADVGQALVADFPGDSDNWLELAGSYQGLGLVLTRFSRFDDAERAYLQGLDIMQTRVEVLPSRPDVVRLLAGLYRSLGNGQHSTKRLQDAEQSHRRAVAHLEKLVNAFPRSHGYREDLTMSRNNLAFVLRDAGRLPEAIVVQGQALDLQIELAKEFPNITQYRRTLAATYMNRGVMLKANDQLDAAADAYGKAVDVMEALVARPGAIPEYRHLLALCHYNLGNLLRETNRLPEAEKAYDKALPLLNALVEGNPDVPIYKRDLSRAYFVLGLVLDRTNRPREVIRICRAALAADPNHASAKDMLAWTLATCPDPTLRDANEAVVLAEQLVKQAKREGGYWSTLGVALYRAGKWDESLAALNTAVERRPGGSGNWFFLAMTLWRLGNKEEARNRYDLAVAWMEKNKPRDETLLRFRAEAADLLKVKDLPEPKGKELAPEK